MKKIVGLYIILILCVGAIPAIERPGSAYFPFSDLSTLQDLTLINQMIYTPQERVVVVYSFSSCKPCVKLEQEIIKGIERGRFNGNDFVFVNTFDRDSVKLKEHVKRMGYQSPYYLVPNGEPIMGYSFPTIALYHEDTLLSYREGYSNSNYKWMMAILN